MKHLYEKFLAQVDGDGLFRRTLELAEIEMGQTTPCHIRAADYVRDRLVEAGVPGVERIDFPADGVTVSSMTALVTVPPRPAYPAALENSFLSR